MSIDIIMAQSTENTLCNLAPTIDGNKKNCILKSGKATSFFFAVDCELGLTLVILRDWTASNKLD